jgi:hypothetical protein
VQRPCRGAELESGTYSSYPYFITEWKSHHDKNCAYRGCERNRRQ